MQIETKLSSTWKKRQILITLMLAAIGMWFFYDGLVAWPRQNMRFLAHQQIAVEKKDAPDGERQKAWETLAASKGWPLKEPEKLHKPIDLAGQKVLSVIMLALSGVAAALLIAAQRQRLGADAEMIHGVRGERIPFSAVTAVDRTKWESKGIAYALYEHNHRKGKLTLDDYKFEGAEQIIKRAEKSLESSK